MAGHGKRSFDRWQCPACCVALDISRYCGNEVGDAGEYSSDGGRDLAFPEQFGLEEISSPASRYCPYEGYVRR